MPQHDVARLEASLKQVQAHLANLSGREDFEELLLIIHRPGWTTVAEFELVSGIVETLQVHAQAMVRLKQALMAGSRQVGGG